MEGQEPGQELGGARCAAHLSAPAERVCARCGAFMCGACVAEGDGLHCPQCLERLGADRFPLSRDDWSFGRLWHHAWESWKREWVILTVGVLVVYAISFGLSLAGEFVQALFVGGAGVVAGDDAGLATGLSVAGVGVMVVVNLLQTLITGVLLLGQYRMCFDVLLGRPAELRCLFSQFGKILTLFLQQVVVFFAVSLPVVVLIAVGFGLAAAGVDEDMLLWGATFLMLVLFVPFMWYVLGFFFAKYELAHHDDIGAIESIVASFRIVRGVRLETFGVSFVAGLLVLGGLLACCVGIIPAASLSYTLVCALYLTLRQGMEPF